MSQVSQVVLHLWVWKRATEVAAGWREMKEGARGRVRLQAKRPRLGTICKIHFRCNGETWGRLGVQAL